MSAGQKISEAMGQEIDPITSSGERRALERLLQSSCPEAPPHLIKFRFVEPEFILPELDSLLALQGLNPGDVYDKEEFDHQVPFLRARFPSEESARQVCSRAVRIRAIYEVWGTGRDYPELVSSVRDDCPNERKEPHFRPEKRWAVSVSGFGLKLTHKQEQARRDKLFAENQDVFPFQGKVQLTPPDRELFWIIEYYGHDATKEKSKRMAEEGQNGLESDGYMSRTKERRLHRKLHKDKIYQEIRAGVREKKPRRSLKKQRREQEEQQKGAAKKEEKAYERAADPPAAPSAPNTDSIESAQSSGAYQATKKREISAASLKKMQAKAVANQQARKEAVPVAVFFCREIGSAHPPTERFSLKKRAYLGPTSMEAEMAFLMANQALARPGSLVMDPFVGTGSILLPCTFLGATCMGGDIDYLTLKGKQGKTPLSSFDQYNLVHPELLRLDFSPRGRCLREQAGGWLDAIVCDPPYGVRAGAKKSGSARAVVKTVPAALRENHIPQTQQYNTTELMCDLVDAAARMLKVGGRLVYLLPCVTTKYCDAHVPKHACLELIANSEQILRFPFARRLITMVKTAEYDYSLAEQYHAESRKVFTIPDLENLHQHTNFVEKKK